MPEDEQKPEAVGAKQTEVPAEVPQELPHEPGGEGSKDPLDEIEDPTVLRGEAKKFRSIAQRKSKDPEKVETPAPAAPAAQAPASAPAGDVLTKQDLYRINSQKAATLAKADTEFADNWDKVQEFYVNRRGQEDPEAILEDLKDALTLVKARSTPKPGNAAAELQTTPAVKHTSAKPTETGARTTTPILPKQASMKDWYPPPQT